MRTYANSFIKDGFRLECYNIILYVPSVIVVKDFQFEAADGLLQKVFSLPRPKVLLPIICFFGCWTFLEISHTKKAFEKEGLAFPGTNQIRSNKIQGSGRSCS